VTKQSQDKKRDCFASLAMTLFFHRSLITGHWSLLHYPVCSVLLVFLVCLVNARSDSDEAIYRRGSIQSVQSVPSGKRVYSVNEDGLLGLSGHCEERRDEAISGTNCCEIASPSARNDNLSENRDSFRYAQAYSSSVAIRRNFMSAGLTMNYMQPK
jgi:hypothetical protein